MASCASLAPIPMFVQSQLPNQVTSFEATNVLTWLLYSCSACCYR